MYKLNKITVQLIYQYSQFASFSLLFFLILNVYQNNRFRSLKIISSIIISTKRKIYLYLISFINSSQMNTNIQQYLSGIEQKLTDSSTKQKVKAINASVLNQIDNQIIQSRLVIPKHQKKLQLKTNTDTNENIEAKDLNQKFNQLKLKKKAIMKELQAVEMMESTIKLNRSTLKQNSSSTYIGKNAKVRSTFTEQKLAQIKSIYKKQQKFERKIKAKIRKYEQDTQNYRKQIQEQQKQKVRHLCLQKHQEREKYIKEIEKRNKKRQKMLGEQKQKILELKHKQKLFQKLQNNFLKQKQRQAGQLKQKLDQYKKKRQFSFDDMYQHQSKYLEQKKTKDEEREERVKNYKNAHQTKFPCLFLDKIKDEDQRANLQKEQQQEMIRNHVDKRIAYAEQVRKRLQKDIKVMSESRLNQIKVSHVQQAQKWLNTPQKYHRGTQYMRQVNSVISKLPRKIEQHKEEQTRPKVRNYLNDLKKQNEERRKQIKQPNINHVMSNLSLVAAKQDITSDNLARSVKAKIELMNKLQKMRG